MKYVFSSNDARIRLTYDAIMINKQKNILDIDDIFIFFIKSWQRAFAFIHFYLINNCKEEFLKNNIFIPDKLEDFDAYIKKSEEIVRNSIFSSFGDIGIDVSKGISLDNFALWIKRDHTLEIYYANKKFRFAMSLSCLDDIGILYDISDKCKI